MNDNNTGKTAIVHKAGEEGGILIDAIAGHVLTGQQDKPEWSQGLLLANLAERFSFYNSRLGPDFTAEMQQPQAFDMADLGWVGMDEERQEVELEADPEYRSQVIREVLIAKGIIKVVDDEDVYSGIAGGHDFALDNLRTEAEASALEKASTEGFDEVKKTGT